MPKETIKSFIDFFYPPFKKLMPLQTFRYAACGGANAVLGFFVFAGMYQYVFKEQNIDMGFYTFEAYTVSLVISSTTVFIVGFF